MKQKIEQTKVTPARAFIRKRGHKISSNTEDIFENRVKNKQQPRRNSPRMRKSAGRLDFRLPLANAASCSIASAHRTKTCPRPSLEWSCQVCENLHLLIQSQPRAQCTSVPPFASPRLHAFRDAARILCLPLALSSRGCLLRRQARVTDAMNFFSLAFNRHLAAYTVQSATTFSSAWVTVGGYWCEGAELAEFACCTRHVRFAA